MGAYGRKRTSEFLVSAHRRSRASQELRFVNTEASYWRLTDWIGFGFNGLPILRTLANFSG
jgi:hypothetical protein